MYVRDLFASLLRRWYFVLVGLLITSLVCALAYRAVAPRYEARASVVLVPPNSIAPTAANPLLYLGSLTQALQVLVRSVDSDETATAIAARHPGASFSAAQDETTSGPILLVVAQAGDAPDALSEMKTVLAAVGTQLRGLQHDLAVTSGNRIGRLDLSVDSVATPLTKARTRAVIAVGALGALLTLLLTGVADSLIFRFRRRRRADDEGGPATDLESEDQPTQDPSPRPAAAVAGTERLQPAGRGLGLLVELESLRRSAPVAARDDVEPAAASSPPSRHSTRPRPWNRSDGVDHRRAATAVDPAPSPISDAVTPGTVSQERIDPHRRSETG
jgi:hypothetical protein